MNPVEEAFVRLQFQNTATLSTLSALHAGYPFGSLVQYAVHADTSLLFSVSSISEHFKNISANAHVSLAVLDPFGGHDPQKYSRSTVLGQAEVLDEEAAAPLRQPFLNRFPNSALRELAHDFRLVRVFPEKVRWILGFGSMGWEEAGWNAAELDPIAPQGLQIVSHMNFNHSDSLPALARTAGETVKPEEVVQMVFVCATFCELQIRSEFACRRVRLEFSKFCETSSAVRKEIIALLSAGQH